MTRQEKKSQNKKYIMLIFTFIIGTIYFMYYLKIKELEKQEAKRELSYVKSAYDALDIPIWTKSLGDTLTSVNICYEREVSEMVGYKWEREKYIGKPCDSIFGYNLNRMFWANTQEVIRQGKKLEFIEYLINLEFILEKDTLNNIIDTTYYLDTIWLDVIKFPTYNELGFINGTGGTYKIKRNYDN